MPYEKVLRRLDLRFDLVFMDPPYDSAAYCPALTDLRDSGVLKSDSLIVLESDREISISVPGFCVDRVKKYGNILITWVRPC